MTVTVDLVACARCDAAGHPGLKFEPLRYPAEWVVGEAPWTHWAPCPTNGEPILMRLTPVEPEADAAESLVRPAA